MRRKVESQVFISALSPCLVKYSNIFFQHRFSQHYPSYPSLSEHSSESESLKRRDRPRLLPTSKTWQILRGRRRVSRAWQRSSTKPHWKISKKTTKAKSVLTRRLFPGVRSWKFPRQPAANWADLAPSPKLRYFVVTLCMTSPTLAGLNTFTPGINKWVLGSISV